MRKNWKSFQDKNQQSSQPFTKDEDIFLLHEYNDADNSDESLDLSIFVDSIKEKLPKHSPDSIQSRLKFLLDEYDKKMGY